MPLTSLVAHRRQIFVAEQLLELIDDHQQALVGGKLARDLDQTVAAAFERRRIEAGLPQLGGEPLERRSPRPGDDHAPAPARFRDPPPFERRNQAGLDQRRFSAAGDAEDGNEAVALQPSNQLGDLDVPTEEEMRFVGLEWPQARIGILERLQALDDGSEAHPAAPGDPRRSSGVKNVVRRAGSKRPNSSPMYRSLNFFRIFLYSRRLPVGGIEQTQPSGTVFSRRLDHFRELSRTPVLVGAAPHQQHPVRSRESCRVLRRVVGIIEDHIVAKVKADQAGVLHLGAIARVVDQIHTRLAALCVRQRERIRPEQRQHLFLQLGGQDARVQVGLGRGIELFEIGAESALFGGRSLLGGGRAPDHPGQILARRGQIRQLPRPFVVVATEEKHRQ